MSEDQESMQGSVPAPVPGGEPEEPILKVRPDLMASTAADDQAAIESDYNKMVRNLASQPRVRVRLQEVTFIQLNGWKTWLPKGSIEVPAQVANVLIDAGRA